MDSSRFRVAIPQPCYTCNRTELNKLNKVFKNSEEDVWFYDLEVRCKCGRCERPTCSKSHQYDLAFLAAGFVVLFFALRCYYSIVAITVGFLYWYFRPRDEKCYVRIPIPAATVGSIERAIHASSVSEKGSAYRAHANFVHHLSLMDMPEVIKQALVVWAPIAMMGYMEEKCGVTRFLAEGHPPVRTEESPGTTDGPGALTSAVEYDPSQDEAFVANPDVEDGAMIGTQLQGDEYGLEDRMKGGGSQADSKVLARQIGPDLIPTEVFQSTEGNLKAGLAKRVRPLPFNAPKKLIRRIDKTVTALITNVFTPKKIREWREANPDFEEMHSKKWSASRFRSAYIETLAEIENEITKEFQAKINEALPAKGKAPRPIIQTGDRGQVMMMLPVKCMEELMFDYFEEASIKHVPKHEAMQRAACHLRLPETKIIEGDGSAWDACCNWHIRNLTENRIIEHVIEVLGEDADVPVGWMRATLDDMKDKRIKGKVKVDNKKYSTPLKVMIDSIRQSGHRGTSAFNYLINLVCWLSVLCVEPDKMIRKRHNAKGKLELPTWYESFDGKWYQLRYIFEGDDSAISTTEDLDSERVERLWESLGFRMKLKFATDFFTFTGFDFLLGKNGPTGAFCPEIPRNIASSSWTCSSLVKSDKSQVHQVGAAAMLARAENFVDCGPMSRYFSELGLAHAKMIGDFEIGENSAIKLGIRPCQSVLARLHELSSEASPLTSEMRKLTEVTFGGFSRDQEANLLSCSFDRFDDPGAKYLVPRSLWDPALFDKPRRFDYMP